MPASLCVHDAVEDSAAGFSAASPTQQDAHGSCACIASC
jgi:hypothetical protein